MNARALVLVFAVYGCAAGPGLVSHESALGEQAAKLAAAILADSIAREHLPAKTEVRLAGTGPVGVALEKLLRARGYGIVPADGEELPALRYAVEPFDGDGSLTRWRLAASLGDWRTEALFRPAASGEWRRLTPWTIAHGDSAAWPESRPLPPDTTACAEVRIEAGSLREQVAREIEDCGYTMAGWYVGDTGYIDDWNLRAGLVANVQHGVHGLLKLLHHHYGLRAEVRPVSQSVVFTYVEES